MMGSLKFGAVRPVFMGLDKCVFQDGQSCPKNKGYYYDIIQTIAQVAGFDVQVVNSTGGYGSCNVTSGNCTGLFGMLQRGEIDGTISTLTYTSDRMFVGVPLTPIKRAGLEFLVGPGLLQSSFLNPQLNTYTSFKWQHLLGILALLFVWSYFGDRTLSLSQRFAVLVQQRKARFVGIAILIPLVQTAVQLIYLSQFKADFTELWELKPPFQSMNGLARKLQSNKDWRVIVDESESHLFNSSIRWVYLRHRDSFRIIKDLTKVAEEICSDKSVFYGLSDDVEAIVLLANCSVRSHKDQSGANQDMTFYLKKHFPKISKVNAVMEQLFNPIQIERLISRNYLPWNLAKLRKKTIEFKLKPLSYSFFHLPIICASIGFIFGLFVLFLELFIHSIIDQISTMLYI